MKTVLILHGWGGSSKSWARVKDLLGKKGYRVVVPDLPGFGETPAPQRPWMTDDYADWVKSFCEKNGLSQFFLIGHSFGGAVAVKFVNSFPEEVSGLVLVAPKLFRQKTFRYYLGLILSKTGKAVFSVPGVSFLQPLGRKILYFFIGTRDYYRLELQKTANMKETFRNVVGVNLISCLPSIKKRTLIVWGSKDKLTPIYNAYLINKKIEGSRLEVIPGQGHALSLEVPGILTDKILNFIET